MDVIVLSGGSQLKLVVIDLSVDRGYSPQQSSLIVRSSKLDRSLDLSRCEVRSSLVFFVYFRLIRYLFRVLGHLVHEGGDP